MPEISQQLNVNFQPGMQTVLTAAASHRSRKIFPILHIGRIVFSGGFLRILDRRPIQEEIQYVAERLAFEYG